MMISAKSNGFGRHLWALEDPEQNTSEFLLILYVYIILYYSAVVCVKLCMWVLPGSWCIGKAGHALTVSQYYILPEDISSNRDQNLVIYIVFGCHSVCHWHAMRDDLPMVGEPC